MPKIILVGGFLKSQTHALNNLAYMDRQSSLFDENGQEITVREAQQAVRDTESIIWRHYVSFRREDVERLSVDREYMNCLLYTSIRERDQLEKFGSAWAVARHTIICRHTLHKTSSCEHCEPHMLTVLIFSAGLWAVLRRQK